MTVSVYVAASSSEKERARKAMAALEAAGLKNALDWTAVFKSIHELDDEGRWKAGELCLGALEEATALLLLWPTVHSESLWEAGYAHGMHVHGVAGGPVIFVAGPNGKRGIFAADPVIEEHETDEAAIAHIITWAREFGR